MPTIIEAPPDAPTRIRPLTGVPFWILTDESYNEQCGGVSVVGLFSSPENALKCLLESILGDCAEDIVWQIHNEDMWEGHDEEHQFCHMLLRHSTDDIDAELAEEHD